MAGIGELLNNVSTQAHTAALVLCGISILLLIYFIYKRNNWGIALSIIAAIALFNFPKPNNQQTNKEGNSTTLQMPKRID